MSSSQSMQAAGQLHGAREGIPQTQMNDARVYYDRTDPSQRVPESARHAQMYFHEGPGNVQHGPQVGVPYGTVLESHREGCFPGQERGAHYYGRVPQWTHNHRPQSGVDIPQPAPQFRSPAQSHHYPFPQQIDPFYGRTVNVQGVPPASYYPSYSVNVERADDGHPSSESARIVDGRGKGVYDRSCVAVNSVSSDQSERKLQEANTHSSPRTTTRPTERPSVPHLSTSSIELTPQFLSRLQKLSQRHGMPVNKFVTLTEDVFDTILQTLLASSTNMSDNDRKGKGSTQAQKSANAVTIRNFGRFELAKRKPRSIVHIKTGELVRIPEQTALVFRPATFVKNVLKRSGGPGTSENAKTERTASSGTVPSAASGEPTQPRAKRRRQSSSIEDIVSSQFDSDGSDNGSASGGESMHPHE